MQGDADSGMRAGACGQIVMALLWINAMPHADLLAALQQARGLVPDDRHVWASLSDTFETFQMRRRGLLLGGAHSPLFLRDLPVGRADIPWTVRLLNVRVLFCAESALTSWQAWLPMLEAAVQARESLLFVAPAIHPEFLSTLLVNLLQNTLAACVAHPPPESSGPIQAAVAAMGGPLPAPPTQLSECPLFAEARIRRSASVLFPAGPEASSAQLAPLVELRVGGRHYDDQLDRLRFLLNALEPE